MSAKKYCAHFMNMESDILIILDNKLGLFTVYQRRQDTF